MIPECMQRKQLKMTGWITLAQNQNVKKIWLQKHLDEVWQRMKTKDKITVPLNKT